MRSRRQRREPTRPRRSGGGPADTVQEEAAMPTVVFEASALGPAVSAEAGAGRLIDVCDDARAPVVFSCRDARCATCRVEVVEGEQHLEPPTRGELDRLERLGAP